MKNIGLIELEGMEFKAYHGVLEQEKVRGNEFVVDFRGELDLTAAAESDNLNDTLNYAEIYDVVREEMKINSKLLEHVCGRILRRLFERFSSIVAVEISLKKETPPLGGDALSSAVTINAVR